jgi:hypothetical protein
VIPVEWVEDEGIWEFVRSERYRRLGDVVGWIITEAESDGARLIAHSLQNELRALARAASSESIDEVRVGLDAWALDTDAATARLIAQVARSMSVASEGQPVDEIRHVVFDLLDHYQGQLESENPADED